MVFIICEIMNNKGEICIGMADSGSVKSFAQISLQALA